ncbi:MAG: membrane protein insertion efficiency factor YidD [Alphaproteobacteria bacterium]|nr:membrane protein insertion efficiency factor YidD [Alphaproteobacteria bacterium]
MNWLLKGLITVYRYTLSPLLGKNCRYLPTCSEYAEQAIDRFGAFRGGLLALRRIGRCHPLGGHGYDPVPEQEPQKKNDLGHDGKDRTPHGGPVNR